MQQAARVPGLVEIRKPFKATTAKLSVFLGKMTTNEEAPSVYALAFIESAIASSSGVAVAVTRRLNQAVNWKLRKRRYNAFTPEHYPGLTHPSGYFEPAPTVQVERNTLRHMRHLCQPLPLPRLRRRYCQP